MRFGRFAAVAAIAVGVGMPGSQTALAQLTGHDREEFVQAAIASCTKGATADHPEVPAEKIVTYCTCSANAVADVTTMADVEYINSHNGTPSADYQKRMKTVAIACNAKAGLH
jgi:hypothetical protein